MEKTWLYYIVGIELYKKRFSAKTLYFYGVHNNDVDCITLCNLINFTLSLKFGLSNVPVNRKFNISNYLYWPLEGSSFRIMRSILYIELEHWAIENFLKTFLTLRQFSSYFIPSNFRE